MRRDLSSFVAVFACALLLSVAFESQAQLEYTYTPWHETDGVPLDFMTLGDSSHTYVKCAYGNGYSNGNYDYNSHLGHTTGNANSVSHYIYNLSNTNNGTMTDPCKCFNIASQGQPANYVHEKILPPSWDGVLGHVQDKVVRVGCYGGHSGQCAKGQEIEYWFYPPKDSSTLLVYFSFAQEMGVHTADYNPRFYIEVLNAQTGVLIPSAFYKRCNGTPNPSWPYNRFLAVPNGSTSPPNPSQCTDGETGITTYYWAFPEATPTTFDYRVCPENQVTSGYAYEDVQWIEYKPLAFDLKSCADNNQAVKLRIRSRSCNSNYHWAYGLFAAKLVPGYILVNACDDDVITLSVPWGFMENSYEWHYGTDSENSQNILNPIGMSGVSGTVYDLQLDPTAGAHVYPYYRCEMKSYTGVPFTFDAYVKLYKIEPDFDYQQIITTDPLQSTVVQLSNTGTVRELTPMDNGVGFDTTMQSSFHVEWYYKNSVGQYREIPGSNGQMNPVFNVSEATDLDLTNVGMGDDGEPITIMLVMRDSLQKCEKSVIKEIRVSPVSIQDFSTDPIVVYPNPVSNQVTVSMKDGGQLRQVLLYDMEGRLLQSRKVDDSSVTLDVEGLPSGVYSVQARTEKGTTTKRICKL